MNKLILYISIAVMGLLASCDVCPAQDIFGPASYFYKQNDTIFVKSGLTLSGTGSSIDTSLFVNVGNYQIITGEKHFSTNTYFNGINNRGSAFETKYRTTTTQYDTATSLDLVINLDGSADTVIAILPLATPNDGQIITYCSVDVTFPVTILPNESDRISGGEISSLVMIDKYAVRTLKSMNGGWIVIVATNPGGL
jgi:hypothetical protein